MKHEAAHLIACPMCDAPIGASCVAMGFDSERRGLVKGSPHSERVRDSWREARSLALEAQILAEMDAEIEIARLGFVPPRHRSEASTFRPPVRHFDPEAPSVPHPHYRPWRTRRSERSMNVRAHYVHPEFWIVVRDGGMLFARSCGKRHGRGAP